MVRVIPKSWVQFPGNATDKMHTLNAKYFAKCINVIRKLMTGFHCDNSHTVRIKGLVIQKWKLAENVLTLRPSKMQISLFWLFSLKRYYGLIVILWVPNLFQWRNKLIYILHVPRVRKFSANLNIWVDYSLTFNNFDIFKGFCSNICLYRN